MIFDFKENKQFYKAVAILVGTTIGAGIFGLPYAFSRIGFIPGIVYLFLIGLVVLISNLCYGEVVLRTKEPRQMSGYAEKYLGKWGKILISLSLVLGIYSALLAYTIGVGNFLFGILGPYLGGTAFIYSLIFWLLASIAVFLGLGVIASIELFMAGILILVIFFIVGSGLADIQVKNLLFFNFDYKNLFLPFGVALFALGGATAIPVMKEVLKEKAKLLEKSIKTAFFIPLLVYIFFCFSIIGVTGLNTTEQALDGLSHILGEKILLIGGVFGIMAMSTSFLALAYVLREMYRRDYKVFYFKACLLTCIIPLIIFILGLRSFVQVIGISGSILGGFEGILLIMMYYRAKKMGNRQPEYNFKLPKLLAYLIYLVFSLGIIYQIFYLLF